MNKTLSLILVAALAASGMAWAVSFHSFSITTAASGNSSAVIPEAAGTPLCASLNFDVATSAVISVYRASLRATTERILSASTNVYVKTTTDGKIAGHTLALTDYIIAPKSGTTAAGYGKVIGLVTNGMETNEWVILQLDTACTAASNGVVFVAASNDTLHISIPTTDTVGANDVFSGFLNCPLVIEAPLAFGAGYISGMIEYRE